MSELIEYDQILVPAENNEYFPYNILHLTRGALKSVSGFGLAPLHFITQRGPFQDGETPIDMRYNTRVAQIGIAEAACNRTQLFDKRGYLLDYLRPNRAFGDTVRPHIYRKWLPAGKTEIGTDLVIENGSAIVTSFTARWFERGLEVGHPFIVSGATAGADNDTHIVVEVPNDYTVELDHTFNNDETVTYQYRRGWGKRDLYCLLEAGPNFDEGSDGQYYFPNGFLEVLRFVAHDPFWYGHQQVETWEIPQNFGDLVFDLSGAWFGVLPGGGRWVFAPTFVGESVTVVYWGTRFAKPTIEITGPAEYPLIQNSTIDTTISMDYIIAAGEVVTIDTLTQTVYNNAGDNLMPVTSGDIATFQLSPAPQAPYGQNEVFVSFSGGDLNSAARLLWQNRYVGI